jgi:hypothetical protein
MEIDERPTHQGPRGSELQAAAPRGAPVSLKHGDWGTFYTSPRGWLPMPRDQDRPKDEVLAIVTVEHI